MRSSRHDPPTPRERLKRADLATSLVAALTSALMLMTARAEPPVDLGELRELVEAFPALARWHPKPDAARLSAGLPPGAPLVLYLRDRDGCAPITFTRHDARLTGALSCEDAQTLELEISEDSGELRVHPPGGARLNQAQGWVASIASQRVTFSAQAVLRPWCEGELRHQETCAGGGVRLHDRCTRAELRVASAHAVGSIRGRGMRVTSAPVDCSVPRAPDPEYARYDALVRLLGPDGTLMTRADSDVVLHRSLEACEAASPDAMISHVERWCRGETMPITVP